MKHKAGSVSIAFMLSQWSVSDSTCSGSQGLIWFLCSSVTLHHGVVPDGVQVTFLTVGTDKG